MIRSFRSKVLKRYWTRADESGLRSDWAGKVKRLLNALDVAEKPDDMRQPGWGFHALTGPMQGRYSLTVSRNWRLTFEWDGTDAILIDLEDYHGH